MKLKAYCELVRLPNLFTAAADILAGYFFIVQEVHLSASLLLLVGASCSLYAAGIVINDLRDIETDQRERPGRPLPSGRISRRAAVRLAAALCALGLIFATLAWSPTQPLRAFESVNFTALTAAGLLAAILLYDLVLKETTLGPIGMGLCRALNLTLPLALGRFGDEATFRHVAAMVIAFGVFVASFTHFGRDEAGTIGRRRLVIGFFGIVVALLALGVLTASAGEPTAPAVILWMALAVHLGRVGLRAIRQPSPGMVRYAMKTFIFGIIGWGAVIGATTAGLPAAGVILCLLIPAVVVGRWVYST